MSETRWRLTPIDKSGLVYIGLDITNGGWSALFVLYDNEFNEAEVDRTDLVLRETLVDFGLVGLKSDEIEIDFKHYHVIPWSKEFDVVFVGLIDQLINMRMKNTNMTFLTLQLEMAI